jgi:hypothetical protein
MRGSTTAGMDTSEGVGALEALVYVRACQPRSG